MGKLRILFLLLSSSLLLFNACSYNKLHRAKTIRQLTLNAANLQAVIPLNGQSVKYKAEIDVLNKHFTGIVVLKQTDSLTRHLVFVTELGMRMFDFAIRSDSLYPEFVFEAFNKPHLIKALSSSFRSALLINVLNKKADEKQSKTGNYYWINDRNNTIGIWKDNANFALKQQIYSKHKKQAVVTFLSTYSAIQLKQYGLVKLKVTLSRLQD